MYAAFLRGINVGGHRIGGQELGSVFEAMGFRNVSTFRASGNVVFDADGEPLARMGARIEAGLAGSLGYEVATFVRDSSEVRAIAGHQPFDPALVEASKGKLQVAMLSTKPSARVRKEALALATDDDRLAFGDRELYWLPSGGISDSALELKTIERLVGRMTIRTKGTVQLMATKYFSD